VDGGLFAWLCGIVGALITGLYTFRAISITFFGEAKTKIDHQPGYLMTVSLSVLAFFSIALGFLQTPEGFLHIDAISRWFNGIFPVTQFQEVAFLSENSSLIIASLVSLVGIWGGLVFFKRSLPVNNVFTKGFGFDDLYEAVFVIPISLLSRILRRDYVDKVAKRGASAFLGTANILGRAHTGRLSDYAGIIVFSVVIMVAFLVYR